MDVGVVGVGVLVGGGSAHAADAEPAEVMSRQTATSSTTIRGIAVTARRTL
jgi:hypothetical protein